MKVELVATFYDEGNPVKELHVTFARLTTSIYFQAYKKKFAGKLWECWLPYHWNSEHLAEWFGKPRHYVGYGYRGLYEQEASWKEVTLPLLGTHTTEC